MTGENSRETHQGVTYDVQTQDVPERNLIETRIYRNGKILASVRTDCPDGISNETLRERVLAQHEENRGKVRDGSYALVFLWISRGVIAFESQDDASAIECFESVLAIDETNAEANGYLDRIQARLAGNPTARRAIVRHYEEQKEALKQGGRHLEAARKEALLARLRDAPQPSAQPRAERPRPRPARPGSMLRSIASYPVSRQIAVGVATLVLILSCGMLHTDAQVDLDGEYHHRLGRKYLDESRFLTARSIYERLLRWDPESRPALDGLWESYRRPGEFEAAVEALEGLAATPGNTGALARFYLAEACRRASRPSEAEAHYREALHRGAPPLPCTLGIGLSLADQQRTDAAITVLTDLRDGGEADYRLDQHLGMLYRDAGQPGRAAFFLTQALRKETDSPAIYDALAACLEGMHQHEKARVLREKARDLRGSHAGQPLPRTGPLAGGRAASDPFPFPVL